MQSRTERVKDVKDYEKILIDNNQKHIFDYIKMADDEQKQNLIKEINQIDFNQLNRLYEVSKKLNEKDKAICSYIIEHTSFTDKYKMPKEKFERLGKIGDDIIKKGEYAVVTMAGGQGTRLGHKGPKGTFLLNVKPKPKYLFEIIADGLKKANQKYNIVLNWYIMTSTENNKDTIKFFEEHNYFDYPKKSIMFFNQGNLPLLSEDGKLLVDENFNIKFAADGNGCIYKAMKKDGVLDDMKKKGIKWVFIGAVDNALLNMCDPILLGLTIDDKNEIGSKSVVKLNPHERVGVFCKKDNVPAVIEYSEIPEEMAEETDEDGELLFGESHIMCNLYSINALEKIAKHELPYHSAHKKSNFMQENGKMFEAKEPNAYKYEAFIFDGFNFFDDISILRGRREEDFAPVKNKEGIDSPETAVKLYNNYYGKNNKV